MTNETERPKVPSVAIGPGAARVATRMEWELCASFRIVTCYDISTDGAVTRFDVLLNGQESERRQIVSGSQLNCIIQSTSPQTDSNRRFGELILPNGPGVMGAYAVMASPRDLASMFRGLADAIEEAAERG